MKRCSGRAVFALALVYVSGLGLLSFFGVPRGDAVMLNWEIENVVVDPTAKQSVALEHATASSETSVPNGGAPISPQTPPGPVQ